MAIRPSAQLRATIQRTTPPLLILLSAAIIVLGKADQAAFDSLRIKITDDMAPALEVLSRPLGMPSAHWAARRSRATMFLGGIQRGHLVFLRINAVPDHSKPRLPTPMP